MQQRLAVAQERAAAAYASEISTTTDPKRRQQLADKARRAKEAAKFHRETATRLREEG
jgi:hypothetical protein